MVKDLVVVIDTILPITCVLPVKKRREFLRMTCVALHV
jgi:hypothetical protein